MDQVHLGGGLDQFGGEMRSAADADRCIVELTGPLPRARDEFLQVARRDPTP